MGLTYLGFVADKYDLRRDFRFATKVTGARWDEPTRRWHVETDRGDHVVCRFYIMATGCLSVPKEVDIEGAERFAGETYSTGRWPHHDVDFTGERVAVIGTGSSGIQSIPLIAAQAEQLTVFQRSANFTFPAHNGPQRAANVAALAADRDGYRVEARRAFAGVPLQEPAMIAGEAATAEERAERFEWAWGRGDLLSTQAMFTDQGINPAANEVAAELYRERVRTIVDDPATAELLCPTTHYLGTKRPCLDTNYLATYNLPHVRLVDVRARPITAITERGIDTTDESFEFDAIVFATGFDALTGALVAVDIAGRDGVTLKEKWADGPETYLGLGVVGFPNLFTITGPGSPSVLCNMAVAIEQHVDWVIDCIDHLDARGIETIEPTEAAASGWTDHVAELAGYTLVTTADSWYMGANVPGKARMFYVYLGGLGGYADTCNDVAANGYRGFALGGVPAYHR